MERGHGGDVLKFSGDALTILWRVEDEGRALAMSWQIDLQ